MLPRMTCTYAPDLDEHTACVQKKACHRLACLLGLGNLRWGQTLEGSLDQQRAREQEEPPNQSASCSCSTSQGSEGQAAGSFCRSYIVVHDDVSKFMCLEERPP
jgi:hypothetical protein